MRSRSLALGAACAIALLPAPGAQAKGLDCTRAGGAPGSAGTRLQKPIKLTPDRNSETLNFGSTRGTRDRDVVIVADRPLPAGITPDQIVIDLPRRFERAGDENDTAYLDMPTFTEPVITSDRREIKFSFCVNANGTKAGRYVGMLRVGGPEGVERASVPVAVNVRAKYLVFVACLIGALGVAILLLIFRRVKDADEHLDLGFWFQSLIPLGAAAVAMISVYAADPAWGAEPVIAFFTLAGTAVGAAGLKSLLDAGAGRKS